MSESDEFAVIGCCLLGGTETSLEAIESLSAEAFESEIPAKMFRIVASLVTQGDPINRITFTNAWNRGNGEDDPWEHIEQAEQATPGPLNLVYHADRLIERRRRRMLSCGVLALSAALEDKSRTTDDLLLEAERLLSVQDALTPKPLDCVEASMRLMDDLERRQKLEGALSGIASGYPSLDKILDGFQPGEQTIIAARPSGGKTALGLNLVERVCLKNKIPTLFVSLEMSTAALMRRLLSSHDRVPMSTIRSGSYSDAMFKKFSIFNIALRKSPLHIVDESARGINVHQLCSVVRKVCRKHGIKLVVVDYLQKIKPSERHEKKTYEIGDISGRLKALAVATGAAFVTLAQLNREPEKDKKRSPRLSDLADSGQIERDADTVLLIDRDRSDATKPTTLIVAKQRDGETGAVGLTFNGMFCRFESAAKISEEDKPNNRHKGRGMPNEEEV